MEWVDAVSLYPAEQGIAGKAWIGTIVVVGHFSKSRCGQQARSCSDVTYSSPQI